MKGELWAKLGSPSLVGRGEFAAYGLTDEMLVNEDREIAYPIVGDIPVVLAPEAFTFDPSIRRFITDRRYAEAYSERGFYNAEGASMTDNVDASSVLRDTLEILQKATPNAVISFPQPNEVWFRANSDVAAQHAAFDHMAPVKGKSFLQVGGAGSHALIMLMAGASGATVLSPMLGELRLGTAVARRLGYYEHFDAICAVAEEIPLTSQSIDRCYSGGSMHHTWTDRSFKEIARVLKPDGRFASVDVYAAPLHGVGTRIFGKAERGVRCSPMTADRIEPARDAFDQVGQQFHGAVARYPLALAQRLGIKTSASLAWRLAHWEDRVARRSRILTKQSSLVSLCCSKPLSLGDVADAESQM